MQATRFQGSLEENSPQAFSPARQAHEVDLSQQIVRKSVSVNILEEDFLPEQTFSDRYAFLQLDLSSFRFLITYSAFEFPVCLAIAFPFPQPFYFLGKCSANQRLCQSQDSRAQFPWLLRDYYNHFRHGHQHYALTLHYFKRNWTSN